MKRNDRSVQDTKYYLQHYSCNPEPQAHGLELCLVCERSILLNWFFLVNKLNQFTTSNWNSTDLQVTQSNLTFKNLTDTLTRNEPKHRRICSYDEWTHCICKKLSLRSLFTSCALYRCFKNIFAYTFCHCVITWMNWWSEPFHWNKMSKRTSSWKIIVFVGLPEVLDYR